MTQIRLLGVHGPYPAPGEATTGMLLQLPTCNLLLDAGAGTFAEMTKYLSIEDLDGVLLTHHHFDHISDFGILKYAIQVEHIHGRRTRTLPVYANQEPSPDFAAIELPGYVTSHPLNENSILEWGGALFRFAQTKHAISCLAVRMEIGGKAFVFSADSGPSDDLVRLASNADVFICEASWLEKDQGPAEIGHLTAYQAGELAKQAGVKRCILSHLYPGYDPFDLQREAELGFGAPVEVGYRGMVITL